MNYIWSILIILSIIFSVIFGNVKEINNVILTSSFETLKSFGMIAGNVILWSGILEVCVDSGLLKHITFFIKPLIRPLFKTKDEETIEFISANFACNVFALGSASTPFAIKAMLKLQEENENKNKESKDMATLIILNACGFTLIPTSLMALRANYNGTNNELVTILIIVVSLFTTIIMLGVNYLVNKWK